MFSKHFNVSVILLFIICFVISGCCKTTQNREYNLDLTVEIDGMTDHSGISVLLYPGGPQLSQYYGIDGLEQPELNEINTNLLFDHRTVECLAATTTNQTGKCNFTNIAQGEYTIVYLKEGWGFNYLYNINVDSDESLGKVGTLYHEIVLSPTITGNYIFESGKTYKVETDVTAIPGSNLTFEPEANIVLDQHCTFSIMGHLSGSLNSNSFSRVTSSDRIYSPSPDFQKGGSISIGTASEVSHIQGIIFSNLLDGLKIYKSNTEISNCAFMGSIFSLQVLGCNGVNINNNIFYKNDDEQSASIYSYTTSGLETTRNYFIKNWYSELLELTSDCIIQDNMFDSGRCEIYGNWESSITIQNNLFQGGGIGIANAGRCDVQVIYNEINKDICIATIENQNQAGTATMGLVTANNNNFTYKNYAVESKALFGNAGLPITLNFTNNYWGTTNAELIETSIYDYFDSPASIYPALNWAIIDYNPFKTNRVPNAGIRQL